MTVSDIKDEVESRLLWNWRSVLKRAWSIRINFLIAILCAADAAVAYAVDGKVAVSVLIAIISLMASAARLFAQRGLSA